MEMVTISKAQNECTHFRCDCNHDPECRLCYGWGSYFEDEYGRTKPCRVEEKGSVVGRVLMREIGELIRGEK